MGVGSRSGLGFELGFELGLGVGLGVATPECGTDCRCRVSTSYLYPCFGASGSIAHWAKWWSTTAHAALTLSEAVAPECC